MNISRNNSLWSWQWGGLVRGTYTKMLASKKEELIKSNWEKLGYGRYLNTLPNKLAAIQKFKKEFKVYSKFSRLLTENIFKYKRFREATKDLVNEVYKPFIEQCLELANITEEDIAACSQNLCEPELLDAQITLITPMEMIKVRKKTLYLYSNIILYELA